MGQTILDTHQKALAINLDRDQYGTIAEIGAGQETARWFFMVGGAAGTIAKAMSAYDMQFSDSIYGPTSRYVSRDRLGSMLDHEYRLLQERLGHSRGQELAFFAFANTVAARSFSRQQPGHGWLGVMLQGAPDGGAEILEVVDESPALDAGLEDGDIMDLAPSVYARLGVAAPDGTRGRPMLPCG